MSDHTKQNLEILKGGSNLPVEKIIDGKNEIAELFISKVSLRNMDKLGRAWGKLDQEFEIYTGQKPDQFTDDSILAVVEEGRRLNFTSFERWLKISLQTVQPFGAAGLDLEAIVAKAAESVAKP